MTGHGRTNVAVTVEAVHRKAFASALDWPGWSRSGKDESLALEALTTYAPRYAAVAKRAGIAFPARDAISLSVVERARGDASTSFGIPGRVAEKDRRRVSAAQAKGLADLVEAAWSVFAEVVAKAPAKLRKGPRGGGRDRDAIVLHVREAEHSYARTMGIKVARLEPASDAMVASMREQILEVLRVGSDGSPLAGGKWPQRYAARRIGWHVLDHAWEIEDKSEP